MGVMLTPWEVFEAPVRTRVGMFGSHKLPPITILVAEPRGSSETDSKFPFSSLGI